MSLAFSFDIKDIAFILSLTSRKKTSDGQYFDCPFCGGSKKESKLYLNYEKNVFRCNRCGNSGGMLKLYADFNDINDLGLAKRQIEKELHVNNVSSVFTGKKINVNKDRIDVNPSDIKRLNQVYNALLDELNLFPYHEKMLFDRGFTKKDIVAYKYKSMSIFGYKQIAKNLIDKGLNLSGVAGFYLDKNNEWTINFRNDSPGVLIPNIDIDGNIVCLEKRLDIPYKGNKYFRTSSSGMKSGSKSIGCINFCGDSKDETIYLTEGNFKSAISHSLTGKTFAGMPGVSNYKLLEPFFIKLKENGVRRIVETLDMDKITNSNVSKIRIKILEMIKEFGFQAESLTWNEKYKGIDDYLLSCRKEK